MLAQFYHVAGVLALWDVAGQQPVSEAPDFVLIEVPNGVAQQLRRRVGAGAQAVPGQLIEDLLVVRIQGVSTFTLY